MLPLRRRSTEEASSASDGEPSVGNDPDLPLALALQAGDETALNALMTRHQAGLHRFVCRYLLDQTQAADVMQETFVRVFFRIGQFQPTGTFAAWLYRIALNLCRDHARSGAAKRARLNLPFPEDGETFPAGAGALPETLSNAQTPRNPFAETASREEMRLLENAIDELPHDLKSALILAVLENRSQQECAALLDTTPKAVETRVYRARKLLAKRMQAVLR